MVLNHAQTRFDADWSGPILLARSAPIRSGSVRPASTRSGTIQFDQARPGSVRSAPVRLGPIRFGCVPLGPLHHGLARSSSRRTGSKARPQLAWNHRPQPFQKPRNKCLTECHSTSQRCRIPKEHPKVSEGIEIESEALKRIRNRAKYYSPGECSKGC